MKTKLRRADVNKIASNSGPDKFAIRLRPGFCKDRVWLGTITKRFSDFAENVDTSVFWAETTENEVRI